ncbi:hypothetical protein EYF80_007642 [Liparis tanakae]|uniref:Uncharacterized protein n=1 Tax=Liparis tanakae TaxID=230148 RepID=A0A4Z2IVT3_9TELE|nr:hypothetical protein EYF80_007642 [Liparis tanakae]
MFKTEVLKPLGHRPDQNLSSLPVSCWVMGTIPCVTKTTLLSLGPLVLWDSIWPWTHKEEQTLVFADGSTAAKEAQKEEHAPHAQDDVDTVATASDTWISETRTVRLLLAKLSSPSTHR